MRGAAMLAGLTAVYIAECERGSPPPGVGPSSSCCRLVGAAAEWMYMLDWRGGSQLHAPSILPLRPPQLAAIQKLDGPP